jgi:hypothetical protein
MDARTTARSKVKGPLEMKAWLCIPSKRSLDTSTLPQWRAQGYGIALWCEEDPPRLLGAQHWIIGSMYPGYAKAVNALTQIVLEHHPECVWIIAAGDDVQPDLSHSADEIAASATAHFGGTFGVMQPTGDRWGADDPWAKRNHPNAPAYIDRICGSAWYGREYCRRVNRGNGPLWPEYFHMFVDEEAQCVAQKHGVLWQRRDLIQLHNHWMRKPNATGADMPDFLQYASSPAHWSEAQQIFSKRKAQGFPESELIP